MEPCPPFAVRLAMDFPRARVTAPLLHVFVFSLTWVLDWLQRQPLLDGPARWPFLAVFLGDLPVSVVAFGVMFGSDERAPYAAAAWGILGTLWWYFLGRLIEKRRMKA
jgi:hypothetical protein